MKKSWQHYPYHHKGKYIQIGVSCGIISFLLNFLVHTYIGSYEIIYTFWLLVALIFCLNGRRTSHTALATPIRKMPSLSSRAPLGCVAISLLHDEIPRCRRDDQKSRIGSRSSQ